MSTNFSMKRSSFECSPFSNYDFKRSENLDPYSTTRYSPFSSNRESQGGFLTNRMNQLKDNYYDGNNSRSNYPFESPIVSTKYQKSMGEEHSYYSAFRQGIPGKKLLASEKKSDTNLKVNNDEMMLLLREVTLPPNVRKHLMDQELFSEKGNNSHPHNRRTNEQTMNNSIQRGSQTQAHIDRYESSYKEKKGYDKVFASPFDLSAKENNLLDMVGSDMLNVNKLKNDQFPAKVTYKHIPPHHVRVNSATSQPLSTGKVDFNSDSQAQPAITIKTQNLSQSKSTKMLSNNIYINDCEMGENTPRFKGNKLASQYSNHPYLTSKVKDTGNIKGSKKESSNDSNKILIVSNNSHHTVENNRHEDEILRDCKEPLSEVGFMMNSMVFEDSISNCNLLSQFIRYSNEIIKYDMDITNIKEKIAQRNDFPVKEIFTYFDRKKVGRVGIEEIKEGLSLFDMRLSEEEMRNLTRRFVREGKKTLDLHDFTLFFLPNSKRPASVVKLDGISGEIKVLVSRLFNSCIKAEKLFLNMAKKLSTNLPIHLLEVFKQLDLRSQGYFTLEDLKKSIEAESRGFKYNGYELEDLMKRFDSMKKGKISYSDFSNTIVALVRE